MQRTNYTNYTKITALEGLVVKTTGRGEVSSSLLHQIFTVLSNAIIIQNKNKNSAEGVIAPAGAKVTGASIRMWLLNKFISFLAVLTWKTGLKKM